MTTELQYMPRNNAIFSLLLSSTSSEYRSGSVSDYACWRTVVFMVRHRATLLRPSTQFPAALRAIVSGLPARQLSSSHQLVARHLATARSRWLQQQPGTPYHLQSGVFLHWLSFAENSRLFCLGHWHARPHQRTCCRVVITWMQKNIVLHLAEQLTIFSFSHNLYILCNNFVKK